METFGKKSLIKYVKIGFDVIYFFMLGASVVILIFFLIKIFNPNTEILDFTFHKEVTLSELISKKDFDIDIPEIFGMKICDLKATTKFNINNRQSIFLAFISFVYAMGILTFIFYNFRRLFNNLYKNKIFITENAKYISYIGFSLIVSEIITFVLSFIFELYKISINFYYSTITATYNSSFSMLLIGIGLIILGEIFKHGIMLEDEQKLTV